MPRVIHFEIHADDPERAAAFYRKVLGWDITKWDGPMEYWMIRTGADQPGIDGGLLRRQEPRPAPGQGVKGYVCTVDVPSLDEYVGKATANGGHLAMPKMAIPGLGWLAYAVDTEGNLFGMIQMDAEAK